jgi:transposase-like protein
MEQATMGIVPQSNINEERIASLIAEREQSGIPIKEFCKSHQISQAAYYYWRRKLVNKNNRSSESQPAFTMLNFESEASGSLFCEITTAGGGRLRFYQPVPASFLQSLL